MIDMKRLKDKPCSRISVPVKTSGVYAIINNFNGKKYIGSSYNCRGRLSSHLSFLRYSKHSNKHLQNAFDQCSIENFSYVLLEEVNDLSKLYEREQYWIDFYKSYLPENGYNRARFAESSTRGQVPWNKDNWKTKVTAEQLILEYKSGVLLEALAAKYHIADALISGILKVNNIIPKITGRPKGREVSERLIKAVEKYYVDGHTVRECVKKFKMPQSTIRQYLEDHHCLRSKHFQLHPKTTRGY
jgi:group I intron endonuclease